MPEEATRAADARPMRKPRAMLRLGLYLALVATLMVASVKLGYDGTVRNAELWTSGGGNIGGGMGGRSEMLSETVGENAMTSVRAAFQEFLIAVVAAICFAIPVSMSYTLTRRKEGYERATVQMLIILPVLVSTIVLVVKGSLALAFTLAGIVAVVRFRATFRDVKDAVYGCAAIAIGLAAGVHSIVIAGGITIVFTILAVALWKLDIGNVRKDLARMEGDVRLSDALIPVGDEGAIVRGQADVASMNGNSDELAEEAARLERIIQTDAESHKKKERFTHLLLVHTDKAKPTRESVENLLESSTKRWRFVSELPYNNGTKTLEFLARFRPSANESRLLSSIQKEKEVVGVELKAVGALRDAVGTS